MNICEQYSRAQPRIAQCRNWQNRPKLVGPPRRGGRIGMLFRPARRAGPTVFGGVLWLMHDLRVRPMGDCPRHGRRLGKLTEWRLCEPHLAECLPDRRFHVILRCSLEGFCFLRATLPHGFRGDIKVARPDERSAFCLDLPEIRWCLQARPIRILHQIGAVVCATDAVLKGNGNSAAVKRACVDDLM